jgi:hypothetical protein
MAVVHAFGALVVGRLQRMYRVQWEQGSACHKGGANGHPQRIGHVQGNLLLQSSMETNARAPRAYARASLNQAQKFSNAKTAVFRERCGE